MAEINKISNVETENTYNANGVKKNTDNNSNFSSYLTGTKTLDDIFEQASQKYNVSENLLKAIGKAESDFDTKAVSRCGAQGVMQLMPATAKELGVTDSFDAEQNIMGGAKYISGLLKKYDGNTKLALAAYNAGSGNVAKYNGIPPFKETQNYVKKVVNYMKEGTDTNGAVVSNNSSAKTVTAASASIRQKLVLLPNQTSDNINSELQSLDSIFSYDDYLKLINLLFEEENKNTKEDDIKEENKSYTVAEINYNIPVLNLIKNQNLI